jgi:hypothetical protein
MTINKETSIEDLIEQVPGSVEYLMKKGIRCIVCGEPIWGSLEEAAEEKGFNEADINSFVTDLNQLMANPPEQQKSSEKRIDVKKL